MFWCDVCKCAYPHGPEGPGTALEAHNTAQHGGSSPADGVRPITGGQVVIGLLVLVILALAARHLA
ncbi:hypothetical protein [Streptomyces tropicalis]|uniref:Uncharacterized protein n=1 Tax=Streptomyces tropicalis TaxID=3034234 RepID=A0ABT6AFS0_9ACTN|nr:hypothetical protein [Streptomyces tropicalis]MDF3303307.1 hypothetical protein [Streptomyces tropicalis]